MKKTITLKISDELLSMIDELVASGKYKNRSQVLVKALENFVIKERFAVTYLPSLSPGREAEEGT
ncbi:MAG: ribbon-helix-helix domain-containing protein [Fervidicoccaceae archaeon]|nr:MAG: CopG family transcriptional regulator [Fervidicoccus fontis]